MKILIAESTVPLAALWKRHLERMGAEVVVATTVDAAFDLIDQMAFQVIVMNVRLKGGASLAVADFAQFRQPDARVVFVTDSTFFSDGSIFKHSTNACAFLPSSTEPSDLAEMVSHYAHAN
ncbi:response regulator [Tropicibacter naphthalenivorans]|uniref:Response regulator consisting of a CheY-like receiver domain and a Fis-type HTH domain protein n=1 Tax=Tropicibacter naphthalenivorans TaxID=441103 RepID=A0A0P1GRL2_9RHOB|nr:response regulator [Tropicibacter naphthalenivorans]CUH78335.1 Response regulator consisting of a CheY-like receiver domain and a Fis-type HTH domain protein [Tropicibacter naphthalenivorans]SMC79686.1 Response regulator receiver domain-containing protein [Tropicibacter naphthalenivorans]